MGRQSLRSTRVSEMDMACLAAFDATQPQKHSRQRAPIRAINTKGAAEAAPFFPIPVMCPNKLPGHDLA